MSLEPTTKLPPGPRQPALLQTIGWWARPVSFLEGCRERYGRRFTVRLLAAPPFVMLSEPDQIREVLAAPADVLHPGEGAQILEPIVGPRSVILLDEEPHLEQRKLLLPAFHGERMERLSALIAEVAERDVAEWPRGRAIALHPRLQRLTLEIILRAVFGLDPGERLDRLRKDLTEILAFSEKPYSVLPWGQRELGGHGPWARFVQLRKSVDAMLYELIEERRTDAGGTDRDDVLAMLLGARHEDDSPMSDGEIRDELMTALVAGHETTASQLAWCFADLARAPRALGRLLEEIDAGDSEEYLTATVNESLRRRPVLPNAEPRLVVKPIEIGGWTYRPGACLIVSAYLVHTDPEIYPDPYAFQPERFLDEAPGTYTWLPFGGGRRRCIGASFAQVEMRIVLRSLLASARVEAADDALELNRRRSITISPGRGAQVVLRDRVPATAPVDEEKLAA